MTYRIPTYCLFAAAMAFAPALAQAAPAPSDALVTMEANWSKAMVAKDWATVDGIIASDWTGQNDAGKLTTKAMLLGDYKSGKSSISAMTNHDVHARLVGDIGIVQGMNDETSTYDGKDTSGTYSWTDVYQRRGGKWVVIASQVTRITK